MDRRLVAATVLALVLAGGGLGPAADPAQAVHSVSGSKLPDLAMLPPSQFKIENGKGGKRLLRFSTVIVNLGPGLFQVYGTPNGDTSGGDPYDVVQQVEQTDGTFVNHGTDATMFWSGDGHGHFHVRDLQEMTIRNLNAEVLARGAKRGFCFWDNYRYGATTDTYYEPDGENAACQLSGGIVPMGLSVGWGDKYPYYIAFQYIDISTLGNGTYIVEVTADPATEAGASWFAERDETSNNTAWTKIKINRKSVTILAKSAMP